MKQLLAKNAAHRRWQRRRGEDGEPDTSWDAFTKHWKKLCQRRRDTRRSRRPRDHRHQEACKRLPCEAAVDSSRAAPVARSQLLNLDRMPRRAKAQPLAGPLRVFETFSERKEPQKPRVREWAAAPIAAGGQATPSRPTEQQWAGYRKLCAQNV